MVYGLYKVDYFKNLWRLLLTVPDFLTGKTYVYMYETQLFSGLPENGLARAGLKLRSKVYISAIAGSNYMAKVKIKVMFSKQSFFIKNANCPVKTFFSILARGTRAAWVTGRLAEGQLQQSTQPDCSLETSADNPHHVWVHQRYCRKDIHQRRYVNNDAEHLQRHPECPPAQRQGGERLRVAGGSSNSTDYVYCASLEVQADSR